MGLRAAILVLVVGIIYLESSNLRCQTRFEVHLNLGSVPGLQQESLLRHLFSSDLEELLISVVKSYSSGMDGLDAIFLIACLVGAVLYNKVSSCWQKANTAYMPCLGHWASCLSGWYFF